MSLEDELGILLDATIKELLTGRIPLIGGITAKEWVINYLIKEQEKKVDNYRLS